MNKTAMQAAIDTSPIPEDAVLQRTLKRSVSCEGVGVHSGNEISMTLHPAPASTGVVFRRTDIEGEARIPARWDFVVDTRLCSVLGNEDGVTVGTVEHVMAALAGCGVDNVEIEIDGGEVPIMDGSSAPFVELIRTAGVVEQSEPRRVIKITKPIEIEHNGARVSLVPADMQIIDFELDYSGTFVDRQEMSLPVINGAFCKELAGARTFGFLHEVDAMRKAGLAKGGSLDNAIVVGEDGILNEGGLRFDDEFVRHKVLDAVGDLYLAGAPVVGRFRGVCSGHAANNKLLHALFENQDAWTWDIVAGEAVKNVIDGGIEASA